MSRSRSPHRVTVAAEAAAVALGRSDTHCFLIYDFIRREHTVFIVNSRSILVLWPLPRQALKGSEINLKCCLKFTKIYTAKLSSLSQWKLLQHERA